MGKKLKKVLLYSFVIDVIGIGVAAYFILPNLQTDPEAIWTIVIIVGAVLFAGFIMWKSFGPIIRSQNLAEKGEKATATLLEFWDTGTTLNDNPMVGMRLEMHPNLLSPYETKTQAVISRLMIGMLHPGAQVQVSYNPNKPEEVAFVAFIEDEEAPEPVMAGKSTTAQFIEARLSELNDLRARKYISEEAYQKRRDELLKG